MEQTPAPAICPPFRRRALAESGNPESTPIWYELLTNDSKASTAFYKSVIGWKVPPAAEGTPHGYQMIDTAGAHVGGMLTDDMKKNGAKPTWLFYVGVDDVDATAKKVEAAGGKLLMQPFDIPGAGRAAMVADPQGIPFYVMHGSTVRVPKCFRVRHPLAPVRATGGWVADAEVGLHTAFSRPTTGPGAAREAASSSSKSEKSTSSSRCARTVGVDLPVLTRGPERRHSSDSTRRRARSRCSQTRIPDAVRSGSPSSRRLSLSA